MGISEEMNDDVGEGWISRDVQAVLGEGTRQGYTHDELWKLIQAWYAVAEGEWRGDWSASRARAQCAYELSALIGPLAYASAT